MRYVRPLLFVLLAGNTAWFASAGETSKALDAAAWLVLLALFMVESAYGERLRARHAQAALRLLRLAAGIAVIWAMLRYVMEDNALDAVNSALWIAVVVLLEAELRYPGAITRAFYVGMAFALYGGLAVLVLVWALRGEWFDAYDAALWIAAFALLELEIVEAPRAAVRLR